MMAQCRTFELIAADLFQFFAFSRCVFVALLQIAVSNPNPFFFFSEGKEYFEFSDRESFAAPHSGLLTKFLT
jgi:hypothetical protein